MLNTVESTTAMSLNNSRKTMSHKIGSSKAYPVITKNIKKPVCSSQDGRLQRTNADFGDAAYFNHGLRLSANL